MKNTQVKPVFDLLSPIIAGIDKTFSIKSVVEITPVTGGVGKWQLNACNTRWLTLSRMLTISAVSYKIVGMVCNDHIIVTGPSAPIAQNIQIYAPIFTHGTITQTVKEITDQPTTDTWLPMIFLHDITQERFTTDPMSPVNRTPTCDIYVMTERGSDGEGINDLTSDITSYCINPMRNLLFDIVSAIQNHKTVNEADAYNFDVEDWAKWGVYISPKGTSKNYFTENLSGTHLKYDIPFMDKDFCC